MTKKNFAVCSLVILFTACKKEIKHFTDCLPQRQNWTKYEGNPVFTKGVKSWDDGIILGHSVIKSGNTFKMWYSGGHDIFSLSIGMLLPQMEYTGQDTVVTRYLKESPEHGINWV